MNEAIIPFMELKQIIQNSAVQFRKNNDTSESLFHPKMGFVYGYDIKATNDALNAFETTIPSEYEAGTHTLTVSQKLLQEAKKIADTHTDIDTRDFAREVAAYMVMNVPVSRRVRPNLLKRLEQLKDIRPEADCIND
tara:strand:+ start:58 stop:468 length:411 start_codon:yes stop_codon:yes gene_type:complete